MRPIKNLVFKGGGVLGTAYAGALKELDDQHMLDQVEGVAGTSAGALAGLFLTLGYSPDDAYDVLKKLEFKKFQDKLTLFDFPKRYGIYKGDYMLDWLKGTIKEKTGDSEITFEKLYESAPMDLKVFACDLNTASPQEFSKKETPNVKVADALRASMSIPLLFHAWKFEDSIPNDHIYVDGGVMYNFPMTAFKNPDETLGFFIKTVVDEVELDYNEITTFVQRIFKAMLKGQDIDFLEREGNSERVIYIDNLDLASNDFSISSEQKEALFEAGRKATREYLNRS